MTSHLHLHLHHRQSRPRGAGWTPGPQRGKAPRFRPCLLLARSALSSLNSCVRAEQVARKRGQFTVFLMISHRLSLKLMLGAVHSIQRQSEVTVGKREASQGRMTLAGQGSVSSLLKI